MARATTTTASYEALVDLITRADESKSYEALVPQLKKLPELLKEWNATQEQCRALYLLAYRAFTSANRRVEAYDSLVRHLAAETHEVEADTPSLARQAAIEAIRLPQVVQLDNLLGLAAIQQLEQTQPLLLELLKIFAEGSPAAYTQFHDSHPGFLESLGLTHQDCQQKQRVLALTALAFGRDEVAYGEVAKELGVDEGEVETWIIDVVAMGIVDARLDQSRRVVLVNRVTLRSLTTEHWEQMSSRLALWRENLVALLTVVQQNKKLAA